MVVGSPGPRRAVERALARLDAEIRALRWDDEIAAATDNATLGIVVCGPPPSTRPWKLVVTLRQIIGRPVAVAMLVPDDTSTPTIRRIYAAGATVVFEWPRESLVLARVLAEMLGFELARGPARRGDAALARAVVAHLRLLSPNLASLHVDIERGIVSLRGDVEMLWHRYDAEQAVAVIPGVCGVLTSGVHVRARVPDRRIRQAVRAILGRGTTGSRSTMAVSVSAGTVVLAGTIASKDDADHIIQLVARIRGVRGIENDLVVSRTRQASEASVAGDLRKLVRAITADAQIHVAYFGGVAVLTGGVSSMSERRALTRAAGRLASVERVIDKLVVVPPAR